MLHFEPDVSRVIAGCIKIVRDQENKLYDRNFRIGKISDSYLAHLAINEHLMSGTNNQIFRRKDLISWLPERLKGIDPAIRSRILNFYSRNNMIVRSQYGLRNMPGKPRHLDPGRPWYYSKLGNIISIQQLVCMITPRALIFTRLINSGILERFLRVVEFKKLLRIKTTSAESMIDQTRIIEPFPESTFDRTRYMNEQERIRAEKRRRILLSEASRKATELLHQLDWTDRIFTRFFVTGGLVGYLV